MAQNVSNTSIPTALPTALPTGAPSYGCQYTILPYADNRFARGVAVPLHTCLEKPWDGTSTRYICDENKTSIIKQFYNNPFCDGNESYINVTVPGLDDFECDGDPCPSVDYNDRTWVNTSDETCIDGGFSLQIGTFVINQCTFREDDDANWSAIVTCDRDNIYIDRFNGTKECQLMNFTNSTRRNNLIEQTQSVGCQFRRNPPIKPNGYISSIRCPGYNYDDGSDDNNNVELAIILSSVFGGLCCICIIVLIFYYFRRQKLTRSYTELSD